MARAGSNATSETDAEAFALLAAIAQDTNLIEVFDSYDEAGSAIRPSLQALTKSRFGHFHTITDLHELRPSKRGQKLDRKWAPAAAQGV